MILTEHLLDEFLRAMNDIGQYGYEKHGENSFQAHRLKGDYERSSQRLSTEAMLDHCRAHADAYQRGELHDHFNSLRHQLAAIAFNAMMEFYFAGLETERDHENMRKVGRGVGGSK